MVTVLYRQRHGFDVRIYLKDHPPAHAHVWKGDKELRIDLFTFEVSRNQGDTMREIRVIPALIAEHQDLLLNVWKELQKNAEN